MHFAAIGFLADLEYGLRPHQAPTRPFVRHKIISDDLCGLGRRSRARAGWLLTLSFLSGCAGSVSSPTLVGSASPGFELSAARIGEVSAEAGPGVVMTPDELDRISHLVQTELAAAYPGRVSMPGTPPPPAAVNLRLVFTEYDKRNAVARFMLAGLGQIRIAANVTLSDPATNRPVGEYQVSKQFAFGGLYGGFTGVDDVEDGFARSVVAIFKTT